MSAEGIPVEIDNEEQIIRFVLSPVHVRPGKDKLKRSVFRPRAGTDLVSVARLNYFGGDNCKAKAKEVSTTQKYVGLARVLTTDIRAAGSNVEDAREGYYVGHAHLLHGFVVPEDDPPDPVLMKQLDDRCDALLDKAKYFPDPNPDEEKWEGGDLLGSS